MDAGLDGLPGLHALRHAELEGRSEREPAPARSRIMAVETARARSLIKRNVTLDLVAIKWISQKEDIMVFCPTSTESGGNFNLLAQKFAGLLDKSIQIPRCSLFI